MMSHFEFIFIREAGYIVFQRQPYSFDCKKTTTKNTSNAAAKPLKET